MIILLNLAIVLISVMAIAVAIHWKKWWPLVVAGVFIILYNFIQPSYLPKGMVQRSEIPAFEHSDAKIQNRVLQPTSGVEYDARREQQIKDGLPFIKEENK